MAITFSHDDLQRSFLEWYSQSGFCSDHPMISKLKAFWYDIQTWCSLWIDCCLLHTGVTLNVGGGGEGDSQAKTSISLCWNKMYYSLIALTQFTRNQKIQRICGMEILWGKGKGLTRLTFGGLVTRKKSYSDSTSDLIRFWIHLGSSK